MNPSEKRNSKKTDDGNDINQIKDENLNLSDKANQTSIEDEKYVFGWGQYSEITNGRFAMIGFAAIIFIEIISKRSFLDWAGIIH